jgi:hypothetical protein
MRILKNHSASLPDVGFRIKSGLAAAPCRIGFLACADWIIEYVSRKGAKIRGFGKLCAFAPLREILSLPQAILKKRGNDEPAHERNSRPSLHHSAFLVRDSIFQPNGRNSLPFAISTEIDILSAMTAADLTPDALAKLEAKLMADLDMVRKVRALLEEHQVGGGGMMAGLTGASAVVSSTRPVFTPRPPERPR